MSGDTSNPIENGGDPAVVKASGNWSPGRILMFKPDPRLFKERLDTLQASAQLCVSQMFKN
jgi:hypothetical protein